VSLKTTEALYSASVPQYTAAGEDVQVPWDGIQSDGSRNKKIDTRIGEASSVLRELHCSVVTKRELSNTTKLPVFKSVFVPILTCGHES